MKDFVLDWPNAEYIIHYLTIEKYCGARRKVLYSILFRFLLFGAIVLT